MSYSIGGPARPESAAANVVAADRVTVDAAPREVADPRRWRALAVTQFAAFMILLDVSIVNVALPSIERGLAVLRRDLAEP